MEYLPLGNRQALGELDDPPINASGKHVVIIGGGDTGADCLGTAHRQGAASVTQLEIMPRAAGPPRPAGQPVADLPDDLCGSPAPTRRAASGSTRSTPSASSATTHGNVRALLLHEVELVDGRFEKVEGTERELPADLVLPGHGLHRRRSARGCSTPSASRSTAAATCARDGAVHVHRARRLRGRGHRPRAVADRLGDRRGPAAAAAVDPG